MHHALSEFIQSYRVNQLTGLLYFNLLVAPLLTLKIDHCFNHPGKFVMALTPCSHCRKVNCLTIYKNHCFIARNSSVETLLLGDSIIKGLNRYNGTWDRYFPNSFNFGISGDRSENVLWRAHNLPEISYLKNVIMLCGTNNICIDSPYDIAQCLIDTGVCF